MTDDLKAPGGLEGSEKKPSSGPLNIKVYSFCTSGKPADDTENTRKYTSVADNDIPRNCAIRERMSNYVFRNRDLRVEFALFGAQAFVE